MIPIIKFRKNIKFLWFVLVIPVLIFFQNCKLEQGLQSSFSETTESSTNNNSSDQTQSTYPPQVSSGTVVNNEDSKPAPNFPKTDVWPPAVNVSDFQDTACAGPLIGKKQTINVGPGKTYSELTDVPWLSLGAGDVVNIYYRSAPYKTKFGIMSLANATDPFVINGVTDAFCNRPFLDGDGAVTATDSRTMGFGSDIQGSGIILIHRPPNTSATYKAKYIIIQNLKFTHAKAGYTFKDNLNAPSSYGKFSAAIYSPRVDYLYVKNCEFVNNAMAIFTNSKGGGAIDFSSYLIIRGNYIDQSGYSDDDHEHGLYTQGYRTLIEGNFLGQANNGSSVKDRSSGTVFRYNKVFVSARGLDLVESEEDLDGYYNFNSVKSDPLYNYAWVYGNTFVNEINSPGGFSIRMIHWGFDNSSEHARNGTLYFYNNTVLNKGNDPTGSSWYTSVFQMGSGGYSADNTTNYKIDAWENIFENDSTSAGYGKTDFRLLWDIGRINFFGKNFLTTNWKRPDVGVLVENSSQILESSTSVIDQTSLVPLVGAQVLNQGVTYSPNFSAITSVSGVDIANLVNAYEFQMNNSVPRINIKALNSARDLGAIEKK